MATITGPTALEMFKRQAKEVERIAEAINRDIDKGMESKEDYVIVGGFLREYLDPDFKVVLTNLIEELRYDIKDIKVEYIHWECRFEEEIRVTANKVGSV